VAHAPVPRAPPARRHVASFVSCELLVNLGHYIFQVLTLGLVLAIALRLSRWEHGRGP
jgi:hypothetical protein